MPYVFELFRFNWIKLDSDSIYECSDIIYKIRLEEIVCWMPLNWSSLIESIVRIASFALFGREFRDFLTVE